MSQVKKGAVLSYISIFANILVAIIYTPFFIRALGADGYGLYNMAIAMLAYVSILDLGFGNTIAKTLSENRITGTKQREQDILGHIVYIYGIVSIIVAAIGILLYFNVDIVFKELALNEQKELQTMILWLIVFIILQFVPGLFNGILQAYQYFAIAKTMLLIRVAVPPIVSIPFLLQGYGALTVLIITITIHLAVLVIGAVLCMKRIDVKFNLKGVYTKQRLKSERRVTLYLSLILLSVAIELITLNTGQLILGSIKGTVSVAVFVIAIQFVKIYQQFATSIQNVTFPTFTTLVAKESSNETILNKIIQVSKIQLIALSFIMTGFIIFGQRFIVIWAGEEFEPAYIMTVILMITITMQLTQLPFVSIVQAKNKQGFRLGVLIFTLILMITGSLIFGSYYGGMGVTLSIAGFSFVLYTLIMNVYYKNTLKLNVQKFWFEIIKTLLPIIVLTAIYYFLYHFIFTNEKSIIDMVIHIPIYSIMFMGLVWIQLVPKESKARIKLKLTGVFS